MSVKPSNKGDFTIFTYGDVTAALRLRHRISERGKTAFRGRFQRFQEARFPAGINTGRGGRAYYDWSQIIQLGLAIECLELGLTPERAIALLKVNLSSWLDRIAEHTLVEMDWGYAVMLGGGLRKMQDGPSVSGGGRLDEAPDVVLYVGRDDLLEEIDGTSSACIVDLDRLREELIECLEAVTDHTFSELRAGLAKWAQKSSYAGVGLRKAQGPLMNDP